MKIKNGDILKILLENDEIGYAEKVGNSDDGKFEVFFLKNINADLYEYEEDYCVIQKESIMKHVRVVKSNYKAAWLQFGLEMYTDENSKIKFKHLDIETNDHESVSSLDKSTSGSDELSSEDTCTDTDDDEYDSSFIDDSEYFHVNNCECPECTIIKDENKKFDEWIPTDNFGRKIKNVINAIETKVRFEHDNNMF